MPVVFYCMLLTTGMYYLGARAMVTQWLWSRYPDTLDSFMSCAACSGFWYGVIVGVWCWQLNIWPIEPLKYNIVGTLIAMAFGSMVWTPIVARVMIRSMESTPE